MALQVLWLLWIVVAAFLLGVSPSESFLLTKKLPKRSHGTVGGTGSVAHVLLLGQQQRHNQREHQRQRRPDAVVFPPDPNETGAQVVDRVFAAFGLHDKFPKDVMKQVDTLIKNDQQGFGEEEQQQHQLEDYTHLPFITIDNDNSMDLDQAMYIEETAITISNDDGDDTTRESEKAQLVYRVSYALADGKHYVPPLSPLWNHALRQGGTSYYLPGKAIPMLPRKLSEGQMSLNPNTIRRALVFDMYLIRETGHVVETKYCWAKIKSRWKGTYRETSEYYQAIDDRDSDSNSNRSPHQNQEYSQTLDLLRKVGLLRRQLAAQRNVVDYNRDRTGVVIDPKTGALKFQEQTRYDSELYNEQISLLVNTEGAKLLVFLDEQERINGNGKDVIHPIYRTQAEPRQDQIKTLEAIIVNTIQSHGFDSTQWEWKQRHREDRMINGDNDNNNQEEEDEEEESIAAYLKRLRAHLTTFPPESMEHCKWTRIIQIIERQAMMTNVAANYTADPEDGHHSLKLVYYARFSSPMRELVGCFTHKELYEAYTGEFMHSDLSIERDIELRNQVIKAGQRAKETQKKLSGALHLHVLDTLFYQQLQLRLSKRKLFRGFIMGIDFTQQSKSRRVYVKLEDDPPIEIKVYGEDIDYHYNCRYAAVGETYNRRGTTIQIGPTGGSFRPDAESQSSAPYFTVGDRVQVQVGSYAQFYGQTSRSRWIFVLLPCNDDYGDNNNRNKPEKVGTRLSMRNSMVERALLKADDDTAAESDQE